MDRFERDSLASPGAGRPAMKLVNAESRATGSGIFVAGAFPPGEQENVDRRALLTGRSTGHRELVCFFETKGVDGG